MFHMCIIAPLIDQGIISLAYRNSPDAEHTHLPMSGFGPDSYGKVEVWGKILKLEKVRQVKSASRRMGDGPSHDYLSNHTMYEIRTVNLVTNGYGAYLTFGLLCDANISQSKKRHRIPTIAQVRRGAYYQQVKPPDACNGQLYAINRKPMIDHNRVMMLDQNTPRVANGADPGQLFNLVVSNADTEDFIGEGFEEALQNHEEAFDNFKERHKEAFKMIRGRGTRWLNLSRWSELRHAQLLKHEALVDEGDRNYIERPTVCQINGVLKDRSMWLHGKPALLALLYHNQCVYKYQNRLWEFYESTAFLKVDFMRKQHKRRALRMIARHLMGHKPRWQPCSTYLNMPFIGGGDRQTRRALCDFSAARQMERPIRLVTPREHEHLRHSWPFGALRVVIRPAEVWFYGWGYPHPRKPHGPVPSKALGRELAIEGDTLIFWAERGTSTLCSVPNKYLLQGEPHQTEVVKKTLLLCNHGKQRLRRHVSPTWPHPHRKTKYCKVPLETEGGNAGSGEEVAYRYVRSSACPERVARANKEIGRLRMCRVCDSLHGMLFDENAAHAILHKDKMAAGGFRRMGVNYARDGRRPAWNEWQSPEEGALLWGLE